MKTMIRFLFAVVLGVGGASTAFAHARVLEASPHDGESLTAAPTELRLKFNEAIEVGFTSVKLIGPDGKPLTVGKPRAAGADALVLELPALPAGAYQANWSAVGLDGHRTRGDIRFTVK